MAFIVLLVLFLGLSFFLISQQINSLIKKTKEQQKEIESFNAKLDELASLYNERYNSLFKKNKELNLAYQETLDKFTDLKEQFNKQTSDNDKLQSNNNNKLQSNINDKNQAKNNDDKPVTYTTSTAYFSRDLTLFKNKSEPFSLKRIYPGRYD